MTSQPHGTPGRVSLPFRTKGIDEATRMRRAGHVTTAMARDYFYALIRRNMRITGNSWEEAERIERINVGYWSGYYDDETRQRVHALYGFGHPIFGTTRPDPEDAIRAGQAMVALADATEAGRIDIEAFGRAVRAAAEDHKG